MIGIEGIEKFALESKFDDFGIGSCSSQIRGYSQLIMASIRDYFPADCDAGF